jgi:hypothetical protein
MEGNLMSRYEHLLFMSTKTPAQLAGQLNLVAGTELVPNDINDLFAGYLEDNVQMRLLGPDPFDEDFGEVEGYNYDLTIRGADVESQIAAARKLFETIKSVGEPLPVALALNDYQEPYEIFPKNPGT